MSKVYDVKISWKGNLSENEGEILNLTLDLLARAEEMSEEEIETQMREIELLAENQN